MKSLPEKIEVETLYKQKPEKGLLVKLTLATDRKNNYSLILGPTDASGKASITKKELINNANEIFEIALMDYVSLEQSYTGKVKLEVMNKTDIESAINAYEIYGSENYPEDYIDMLNQALSNSINSIEIELHVTQI